MSFRAAPGWDLLEMDGEAMQDATSSRPLGPHRAEMARLQMATLAAFSFGSRMSAEQEELYAELAHRVVHSMDEGQQAARAHLEAPGRDGPREDGGGGGGGEQSESAGARGLASRPWVLMRHARRAVATASAAATARFRPEARGPNGRSSRVHTYVY